MLNQRGFSLLEMLLALALSSLVIMSVITFYPRFQLSVVKTYQQYRLEESIDQVLSGLAKDIRRAGFIANNPQLMTQNALVLNTKKDCVIIRYDSESVGQWRHNQVQPKFSDIFAYRYYKNNLEYQTGMTHCAGIGWEKLFDAKEIKITQFKMNQYAHYIEIQLTASLKNHPAIIYQTTQYVKNENK